VQRTIGVRDMAKRRGHGEGSVYKRKDGRWVAVFELGWQGARRLRKSFYGRTKREALDQLAEGRAKLLTGLPLGTSRQTVGDYLDVWLRDIVKPNLRPHTHKAYEVKVRLHLKPALGRLQLGRLSAQHVQAYVASAQDAGVSAGVVDYALMVLSVALSHAERQALVARNVARLVVAPKVEQREIVPLDLEDAGRFLAAIRGVRLEALYRVALALGIREGEALGLRWQDVDLDERIVRIRVQLQYNPQTKVLELVELKSPKSRRSINLPDFGVRALREHRTRQIEERLRAGEAWEDWQGAGLVFTSELGAPIPARNILRELAKLRETAKLPGLRFHDTRHTCATLLLAQGVSEKVVMEILGHTNLQMTHRYAHVLPPLRQGAADALDAALNLADGKPG
jgi:integrase